MVKITLVDSKTTDLGEIHSLIDIHTLFDSHFDIVINTLPLHDEISKWSQIERYSMFVRENHISTKFVCLYSFGLQGFTFVEYGREKFNFSM